MGKFKETALDNQRRHSAYRAYYWQEQLKNLFNLAMAFVAADILLCAFGVRFEYPANMSLGYLKYGIGFPLSAIFGIYAQWLLKTGKYDNDKKAIIAERYTFAFGLLCLIWGLLGMEVDMVANHDANTLMYIIMLCIITAFFTYPGHHYFLMIAISYGISAVIFTLHAREVLISTTSAICDVLIMIILFRVGQNRYTTGRDRFETEAENTRLLEDLEAQNEELNAGNQELIAINEELNATRDRLEKALGELAASAESQKRFTASMNHELRAPLNGIIGNIQVLLMDPNLTDDDRENLEGCMGMSKSLLGIVNDLLDFAKIEAGEFKILPGAFDLHEVIKNIDAMFKHAAEEKGLKLIVDIPDDMICGLYGDDYRIQQVLTNIVSNGIKYTDEGTVTLSASYGSEKLSFVISDTGQGISEESVKDLFKPYKRIEEYKNRNIQGTGLGMTIVGSLIKQMHGQIDVKSTVGAGTTFTITIPTHVTDAENTWSSHDYEGPAKAGVPSGKSLDLRGRRFLYVDDTKMNLKIIGKLLAETKVELDTTDDPEVGLEMATVNEYDLIFVDHQMPKLTGPELFEKIREVSSKNVVTPVIIFTGNAGVGVDEMYKEQGFAGYLTKPILKEDLFRKISETI